MKEQTKKIILLIIIVVVTIGVLFVALKINEKRKRDLLSTSQIENYLSEIHYEEIAPHVVEQPNTIIYVANSSNEKSNEFEGEFRSVIKKYNLENEIIFININETTIVDPVYQYAPELVFYKDGEVADIIDCETLKSSEAIVKALEERGVIND